MDPLYKTVPLLCLVAVLTSCTAHGVLPPALPDTPPADERQDAAVPPALAPHPTPVLPASDAVPEPPVADGTPAPDAVPEPPVASAKALPPPRGARPRHREASPSQVIDAANREARMAPSAQGYGYGTSTSQRYPWLPGRLFEVYTAPAHPTTLRLPPGERLAPGFAPTLHPALWNVGVIEQGEGAQAFHAIIIRPVAAGQEATTPLLLRSGKALYCRLRSFVTTSMVEVTWEAPPALAPPPRVLLHTPPAPRHAHAVRIPPAPAATPYLHTAYRIAVDGAATPPWKPARVWDDGTTTVLLFRHNLQFTNAPAVFVRTQRGGRPQLAQFTVSPQAPEGATAYYLRGLWPLIELRGEGMTVTIEREASAPPAPPPVPRPLSPVPQAGAAP